jgi:DNA ligase D-like protein (predicted 3'-phosphoesterase)
MAAKEKLESYRSKRDFDRSPEPKENGSGRDGEPRFTIQKHDARTLHYDVRLEIDGVLASWSVPKGPSTDPRERRLAIRTEDHPVEYADFEGVIPEGEYGAGPVLVWDRGTFRNLRADKEGEEKRSLAESLEEGKIEVWLQGEKLRGGFALIHTGQDGDDRWMLVKMKDEGADARRNPTSTEPRSVISDATLETLRETESG